MTNRNHLQGWFIRWMIGVAACAMALTLCPLTAWAAEAVSDEVAAAEEGETHLTAATVYCYEAVWYDDSTVTDPGRRRFLGTHVAEGLEVGHVIERRDLWKLVAQFGGNYPDYMFFDGGSVYGAMKENPEENVIVLVASRTKSPSIVNYYLVGEAAGAPLAKGAPLVSDVDGVPVSFWKMGSYDVESLKLGTEITSEECAVPLDHLVYLASDKPSIAVEPLASRNEINLFYTIDTATTLPDDNPVEDAPATDQPNQPEGGDADTGGPDEPAAPDQDGSSTDGGSQVGQPGEGGENPTAPGADASPEVTGEDGSSDGSAPGPSSAGDAEEGTSVIEDDRSPLAAEYHEVLLLPQTNDSASDVAGVLAALGAISLGVVAVVARRRKDFRS